MEIKGIVKKVLPLERGVAQSGPWARATVVVEYEHGQYPKSIALTNMKKAEDFARIRYGDSGTFKFDVKVREYNGKVYNDVTCWAWDLDQNGNSSDPI